MQVFIDTSGNPHPNDPCTYSVLLAVSLPESYSRFVTRELHNLKRSFLDEETINKLQQVMRQRRLDEEAATELKGALVLGRPSFRQIPKAWELVESVFEVVRNLELAVFAIVMPRPGRIPYTPPGTLPKQYRFLLQRINDHLENKFPNDFATVIFDEQHRHHDRALSEAFTNFMFRTEEGRHFQKVLEVPLFVSSSLTPAIQLADIFAYCGREYYEAHLKEAHLITDPYLHAIKRFWEIVKTKTFNYPNPLGYTNWGIFEMEERHFDFGSPEGEAEATQIEPLEND